MGGHMSGEAAGSAPLPRRSLSKLLATRAQPKGRAKQLPVAAPLVDTDVKEGDAKEDKEIRLTSRSSSWAQLGSNGSTASRAATTRYFTPHDDALAPSATSRKPRRSAGSAVAWVAGTTSPRQKELRPRPQRRSLLLPAEVDEDHVAERPAIVPPLSPQRLSHAGSGADDDDDDDDEDAPEPAGEAEADAEPEEEADDEDRNSDGASVGRSSVDADLSSRSGSVAPSVAESGAGSARASSVQPKAGELLSVRPAHLLSSRPGQTLSARSETLLSARSDLFPLSGEPYHNQPLSSRPESVPALAIPDLVEQADDEGADEAREAPSPPPAPGAAPDPPMPGMLPDGSLQSPILRGLSLLELCEYKQKGLFDDKEFELLKGQLFKGIPSPRASPPAAPSSDSAPP